MGYFKYLNRYFLYKLCTYEISEIVSGYDAKPIEKLAINEDLLNGLYLIDRHFRSLPKGFKQNMF